MIEIFKHTVNHSTKSQGNLQLFFYRPLSLKTTQSYSI